MYQSLITQLEEGLLTVTINRPDKMNALNTTVITELSAVLADVYANDAIKVMLLTGAGSKAFVAGADISEFPTMGQAEGEQLARVGQTGVFDKIEHCPKPIIAAVNGFALGGGCELAMSCHFRVASDNARFGQPEVNLGLIPGYGGTQRLTQLVGKGKAMELILTGDMIDAQEAKALGLINHIYPQEQLLDEAKKILKKIQTKAPIALAKSIASINEAAVAHPEGFEREMQRFGECFATQDMKEGAAAFLEKRKPVFTNK